MFTEAIETFVIEPIFHDTIRWDSPWVPLLFIMLLFVPVCYFVVRNVYFGNGATEYN